MRGEGFACTLSSSLPHGTAPCQGCRQAAPEVCSKNAGRTLWSLIEGKGSLIPLPNSAPTSTWAIRASLWPPPKRTQGTSVERQGTASPSSMFPGERRHFCSILYCILVLPLVCFCGFMFLSWRGNFWLDMVQNCCLAHVLSCSINFWFKKLSFNASLIHQHIFLKLDHKVYSLIWLILLVSWHKPVLAKAGGSSWGFCRWNHLRTLLYESQLAFM